MSFLEFFFEQSKQAAILINKSGLILKNNKVSREYNLNNGDSFFDRILPNEKENFINFLSDQKKNESNLEKNFVFSGFPIIRNRTVWTAHIFPKENKILLVCDQLYKYTTSDFLFHTGLMRNVLDHDVNILYITNSIGKVIFGNKAFYEHLKVKKNELELPNITEEKLSHLPGYVYLPHLNPKKNSYKRTQSLYLGKKEHWYEILISTVSTTFGENVNLFIAKDISYWKIEESEFLEKQQKLFHVSKIHFLHEMAGSIAHEINNPLTIILGNNHLLKTNVLEQKKLDPNFILKRLKIIEDAALRVSKSVHLLRVLSPGKILEDKKEAKLGEIIDSACFLFSENFKEEKIKFEFEKSHWGTNILCKPADISQIFINLFFYIYSISNANKKNQKHVLIQSNIIDHEIIDIHIKCPEQEVTEQMRKKIFEPVFSSLENSKGIGFGLNISRKIAEDHSGSLLLDKNSNTINFILKIPLKYKPDGIKNDREH